MKKIHVSVVHYSGCRNLVLRYDDPVSGKTISSTTYRDPQTGEQTKTTDNRKFARKLAAMLRGRLEQRPRAGAARDQLGAIPLAVRGRGRSELGRRTADRIQTVFKAVERSPKRGRWQAIGLERRGRFPFPGGPPRRQAI